MDMRTKIAVALVIGAVGMLCGGSSLLASEDPVDACSLLTQARVSAVLGVSVGPGEYVNGDVPGNHPSHRLECRWGVPGEGSFGSKRVLLHMIGPIGKLTPAERFENAKKPVQGITKTPVSGVGDDAYYIESGLNTSLYLKKGSSVLQIIVFGFSAEQIKAMEKALGQEAAAKL